MYHSGTALLVIVVLHISICPVSCVHHRLPFFRRPARCGTLSLPGSTTSTSHGVSAVPPLIRLSFDGGSKKSQQTTSKSRAASALVGGGGAVLELVHESIRCNESTSGTYRYQQQVVIEEERVELFRGSYWFGDGVSSHLAEYMALAEGLYATIRLLSQARRTISVGSFSRDDQSSQSGGSDDSSLSIPIAAGPCPTLSLGRSPLQIQGDSELVINHLNCGYLPRDPQLRAAHRLCAVLLETVTRVFTQQELYYLASEIWTKNDSGEQSRGGTLGTLSSKAVAPVSVPVSASASVPPVASVSALPSRPSLQSTRVYNLTHVYRDNNTLSDNLATEALTHHRTYAKQQLPPYPFTSSYKTTSEAQYTRGSDRVASGLLYVAIRTDDIPPYLQSSLIHHSVRVQVGTVSEQLSVPSYLSETSSDSRSLYETVLQVVPPDVLQQSMGSVNTRKSTGSHKQKASHVKRRVDKINSIDDSGFCVDIWGLGMGLGTKLTPNKLTSGQESSNVATASEDSHSELQLTLELLVGSNLVATGNVSLPEYQPTLPPEGQQQRQPRDLAAGATEDTRTPSRPFTVIVPLQTTVFDSTQQAHHTISVEVEWIPLPESYETSGESDTRLRHLSDILVHFMSDDQSNVDDSVDTASGARSNNAMILKEMLLALARRGLLSPVIRGNDFRVLRWALSHANTNALKCLLSYGSAYVIDGDAGDNNEVDDEQGSGGLRSNGNIIHAAVRSQRESSLRYLLRYLRMTLSSDSKWKDRETMRSADDALITMVEERDDDGLTPLQLARQIATTSSSLPTIEDDKGTKANQAALVRTSNYMVQELLKYGATDSCLPNS